MGWLFSLLGGPIISEVVGAITGSIKGWAERKRIRTQAKIELEHKRLTADIDWDMAQVEASAHSWKDEFWTILLAIPMIMAFIPGLTEYVAAGFRVLRDDTPEWYKAAVGVAIAAAFGVRQFSKLMSRRLGAQSKPKD